MDTGIFEIILYAIIGLVSLIVIGISYLVFRLIKKKTENKLIQLISIIPILAFCILLYRAFVPGDSFYQGHFKYITDIKYPENGNVIFGEVTSMDEFGDGTYTSLHKIEKDIIKRIPNILIEKEYQEITPTNDYEFENDYGKVISEFRYEEIGQHINIAILEDSTSLFIQINNW